MSFEELPHTADIRIRVTSPELNSLFSDAADALMEVMYGTRRSDGIQRKIDLESPDLESLLTDFLSEILYISDVDGMVISHTDVAIRDLKLAAVLHGEPYDPQKHSAGTEVKGISYTGMSVHRDANGYMVEIVFDV